MVYGAFILFSTEGSELEENLRFLMIFRGSGIQNPPIIQYIKLSGITESSSSTQSIFWAHL